MAKAATAKIPTPDKLPDHLQRVYDAYRTSLLNVKYYGYKLQHATRLNTGVEALIAITGAGGVSGWAIWNTGGGQPIWAFIAGTSALLAAIKPVLPLTRNISRYSQLHAGHTMNYLALKDIVDRIRIEKDFTRELERDFEQTRKRHREMAGQDDPDPSKRLIDRFQGEVNAQIPVSSLWCPS
jgi:hypothetical protein